jgi:hypothetical protein
MGPVVHCVEYKCLSAGATHDYDYECLQALRISESGSDPIVMDESDELQILYIYRKNQLSRRLLLKR